MADKPKDLKPAMEHGEIKVIKNAPIKKDVDPGKTPGSVESDAQQDEPVQDRAGKTPGNAEG